MATPVDEPTSPRRVTRASGGTCGRTSRPGVGSPGRRTEAGVLVERIRPGSPADRAGLKPGDRIVKVDGEALGDFLDFYLASFGPDHDVGVIRDGRVLEFPLVRRRSEDLGAQVRLTGLKSCGNRCVFCFVDQLPQGLRRELYFKDEDYRLSFLHGNYLTLTNLGPQDEARIIEQHLSPLYVSVHATDERARSRLLGRKPRKPGNSRKPGQPVLETLKRLGRSGIRFHVQIVTVPGYNDRECLTSTLRDLAALGRTILSVSVVPVGLTSHRRGLPALKSVGRPLASSTVAEVAALNRRRRSRAASGKFFVSDEMLAIAGAPVPPAEYYDDFPQIENGVGLARQLLDQLGRFRVPRQLRGRRLRLVTGVLAAPLVAQLALELQRRGTPADVVVVGNTLFGPSVTVSGLLPGRAMLEALEDLSPCDAVVLPPDVVNVDGLTLDGLRVSEIAEILGVPVVVASHDLAVTLAEVARTLRGRRREVVRRPGPGCAAGRAACRRETAGGDPAR